MRTLTTFANWIILNCLLVTSAFSQVGVNTTSPHASAALDVTSTTKGLLPPRMTELQRFAIVNPSAGLIIWCLDCGPNGQLQVYNGTTWTDLVGDPSSEGPCGATSVTFSYNNATVTYNTVVSNGRCWLDRNLGATQVATSSTDALSFGHLFQWGRLDDGHQIPTSGTTATLATMDVPGHGDYITTTAFPFDWRNPQNPFLWQGKLGINNPCPTGYRIPTETEWNIERLSWATNNAAGAFGSPLKLPLARQRGLNGTLTTNEGRYWTSTKDGVRFRRLTFTSTSAVVDSALVGRGSSVRCIKDTSSAGTIQGIICSGLRYTDPTLLVGVAAASGTFVKVAYEGGNGGFHAGQTIASTNVTGLTAYLYPGQFAVGDDSLTYFISGTPTGVYNSGNALFALNIGGQTCNISVFVCGTSPVLLPTIMLPGGGVSFPFVSVVSAGRCWADRNLGAPAQATSSSNSANYGWLFQWGRHRAIHAMRTSTTFDGPINTDQGQPTNFILVATTPFDWRSPANSSLWQGGSGDNNPCNSGNWRVPTSDEWETERLSWSSNNAAGAFASPLKLTVGGLRDDVTGVVGFEGTEGRYWSTTVTGSNSNLLGFDASSASLLQNTRGTGYSVRCILD